MAFDTRILSVVSLTALSAACSLGGTFIGSPVIGSVNGAASPAGAVGAQVIISGVTFGDVQGSSQVLFTNALGGLTVAGAIAKASDWTNTLIITTVPAGAFSGAVAVQTGGGLASVPFTVSPDVPAVPFTPSTVSWTNVSHPLPVAVSGNALAYARVRATGTDTGFVYSVGGADNTGAPTTGVYYAAIATDGSVGPWTATTALPQALAFHAAVAATPRNSFVNGTGYLYVLGGATSASGTSVATVYRAALSPTGPVGSWTPMATLPVALHSFGALIYLGSMFVVGGANSSNLPGVSVYRSPIQIDGSLSWAAQASLPAPRARLSIGAFGLHLYAIGGDSATIAPDDPRDTLATSSKAAATVFLAALGPASRNVGTWSATGSLETPRSAHAAVIAGANILVIGGLYSGALTGSHEDSYAAITAADGTVGTFALATGGLTSNLFNHAAVGYLSTGNSPTFHLLVAGGDDVNAPGTKRAETFTY